jgi:hypothetical protein
MQQVSLKFAARILLIAVGLTLVAGGLNTLVVFPRNPVSPIVIPLGLALSAVAVPREHWGLAFSVSASFAGILVLGRVLRSAALGWLNDASQPDSVPGHFYWALLYFLPLVAWWLMSGGRKSDRTGKF